MEFQCCRFLGFAIFMLALLSTVNGFGIFEQKTKAQEQPEAIAEAGDLKNGIVLIGLHEVAKNLSGYGVIPILEKDIINLFDANATLGDKVVGDSRKFSFNTNREAQSDSHSGAAASQSSRLLPLVTAPKKALLLFALTETFLKSSKSSSNCVVLSKEDLEKLLNQVETPTAERSAASKS